jgi:hypothetical protein
MNTPDKKVREIAEGFREFYPQLSVYESLNIAVQLYHSLILRAGLMVNDVDRPVALEAIAMQMGFSGRQFDITLPDAIMSLKRDE